jgi:hypothetical protein
MTSYIETGKTDHMTSYIKTGKTDSLRENWWWTIINLINFYLK